MQKLIVICCLISAIALSAQDCPAKRDSYSYKQIGDLTPFTKVVTIANSELSFQGKVVLVNFFATWCSPCKAEMSELQKLWELYHENPQFVMIAVGREETKNKLIAFGKAQGTTFPLVADPKRELYGKFAKGFIPRNYLLDRQGKIIFQSRGFTEDEFAKMAMLLKNELDKDSEGENRGKNIWPR